MKKEAKTNSISNFSKILIVVIFILILVIIFNLNAITGNVTQEDCSCINADVNRDKILDVRDLNIIVDCVNNKNSCNLALADINKDKLVNNLDLSLYNECHRKEIPGNCYLTNLNITGNKGTIYVYANNQRIAKKDNTGLYYYHNDALGSPRAISNSDGEVVERIDYLPFGEEITNSQEKVKYNSKELDKDTNLLYYGARYYNSPSGRFLTADSVKGSLTDPQSLNLYSYVKNNPLKYIDPSGNEPIGGYNQELEKKASESEYYAVMEEDKRIELSTKKGGEILQGDFQTYAIRIFNRKREQIAKLMVTLTAASPDPNNKGDVGIEDLPFFYITVPEKKLENQKYSISVGYNSEGNIKQKINEQEVERKGIKMHPQTPFDSTGCVAVCEAYQAKHEDGGKKGYKYSAYYTSKPFRTAVNEFESFMISNFPGQAIKVTKK